MKVYVVGSGPAGMTAAITAARNGNNVVLLEKNEKLGKKLYITGKGRCNYTNYSSFDNYIKNIVVNHKFLYSALKKFDCQDAMDMMESAGIKLKTERGNRVFPASDKSSDIIKGFERLLKETGVKIQLRETVEEIIAENGAINAIKTSENLYNDVDYVILATGGISYKPTGSTGDGYLFASRLGHEIVPPVGGLVGINISGFNGFSTVPYRGEFRGITLKNVDVGAYYDGKLVKSEFGEMLFTDEGVSGPIILTISSYINRLPAEKVTLKLDMKPALTEETLDNRLVRELGENSNRDLNNILRNFLPTAMVKTFVAAMGIDGGKKGNAITKEERKRIVNVLKGLKMPVLGLENTDRAVITSGGIAVNGIDPSTMRSKIIKNLAFAGEIIDVDALTGGYNIQIAISTGYAAGNAIK